jgi:Protein of unknown function (DUF4231)
MSANRQDGSLAGTLERAINRLDMKEDNREWMKDRWLDQVLWFDKRAAQANLRHSGIRIVAVVGGILVPALVTIASRSTSTSGRNAAGEVAFVVSLLVAIAVGLDSFFHFGDRWRHFRRTAELLKTEGWLFIEGAGRYKAHQHFADFHDRFFPFFASKVEELIRRDVEIYLTQIVQEQPEDKDQAEREVRAYLDEREKPTEQNDGSRAREGSAADPGPRAN